MLNTKKKRLVVFKPVPAAQAASDNLVGYKVLKLKKVISPKLLLRLAFMIPTNTRNWKLFGERDTNKKLTQQVKIMKNSLCQYLNLWAKNGAINLMQIPGKTSASSTIPVDILLQSYLLVLFRFKLELVNVNLY